MHQLFAICNNLLELDKLSKVEILLSEYNSSGKSLCN